MFFLRRLTLYRRRLEWLMSLKMPEIDQAVLARRAEIVRDLARIVPGEGVISG